LLTSRPVLPACSPQRGAPPRPRKPPSSFGCRWPCWSAELDRDGVHDPDAHGAGQAPTPLNAKHHCKPSRAGLIVAYARHRLLLCSANWYRPRTESGSSTHHCDPRARAGCSNCGARHCGTHRPAVTARSPEVAVTALLTSTSGGGLQFGQSGGRGCAPLYVVLPPPQDPLRVATAIFRREDLDDGRREWFDAMPRDRKYWPRAAAASSSPLCGVTTEFRCSHTTSKSPATVSGG
jgi:hypothetical protein